MNGLIIFNSSDSLAYVCVGQNKIEKCNIGNLLFWRVLRGVTYLSLQLLDLSLRDGVFYVELRNKTHHNIVRQRV